MSSSLSATSKFQSAIPSVLQGISPSLSALHATRATLLNNHDAQIDCLHCPRCGAFVLHQNGKLNVSTSWVKRRHRTASTSRRSLQTNCSNCRSVFKTAYATESRGRFSKARSSKSDLSPAYAGDPDSQSACNSNNALFLPPNLRQEPVQTTAVVAYDRPVSSVIDTANAPSLPKHRMNAISSTLSPVGGASRQKKTKLGLQEMLRRNKEKETANKAMKPVTQGGLAAFLGGL